MARPYSIDLREWVVAADLREWVVAAVAAGKTCRKVAAVYWVSVASVVK